MVKISEEDQYAIRYNIWTDDDILADLQQWQEKYRQQKNRAAVGEENKDQPQRDRYRVVALTALAALAKKYGLQQRRKQRGDKSAQPSSTKNLKPEDAELVRLSLVCQEAAYVSLKSLGDGDDAVVAASFALLALVAKSELVRERHLTLADAYGLDVLIRCMSQAMKRAHKYDDCSCEEQEAAELQRKACLMLGALSDGDSEIARQVVEEGGLKAILDAVAWYRFHQEVANWALWAIFILCYENAVNKVAFVQLDGIPIVLQAMKHSPDNIDVARHGTAILFDLLRNQDVDCDHPRLDMWMIRNKALSAGLHERIVHTMNEFTESTCMDIVMMGREILVGTGYQGVIPEPKITLAHS